MHFTELLEAGLCRTSKSTGEWSAPGLLPSLVPKSKGLNHAVMPQMHSIFCSNETKPHKDNHSLLLMEVSQWLFCVIVGIQWIAHRDTITPWRYESCNDKMTRREASLQILIISCYLLNRNEMRASIAEIAQLALHSILVVTDHFRCIFFQSSVVELLVDICINVTSANQSNISYSRHVRYDALCCSFIILQHNLHCRRWVILCRKELPC